MGCGLCWVKLQRLTLAFEALVSTSNFVSCWQGRMLQSSPRDKSCHPACLQSFFPDFTPSYRRIPSIYGWDFPFFSSLALSHLLFQKSFLQPQASLPSFPTLSHHWWRWPSPHTPVPLLPLQSLSAVECLFWRECIIFAFVSFLASFCCGGKTSTHDSEALILHSQHFESCNISYSQ